jgi:hypothetical protein
VNICLVLVDVFLDVFVGIVMFASFVITSRMFCDLLSAPASAPNGPLFHALVGLCSWICDLLVLIMIGWPSGDLFLIQ